MRRSFLPIAILASAAALVLAPHRSSSQANTDVTAARDLLATSYMDALLNPAKGEDTDFFVRAGGVPNIFFLLDSSGAMSRLPPDGPASYGGPGAPLPPGVLLTDPSVVNATAAAARTVGCGLDAISVANPLFAQNPTFVQMNDRKFYTPCGVAQNQALVGDFYKGDPSVTGGADYAYQSSACPYYTSSDSQTYSTNGGYDPEFYNPAPNNLQIPSVLFVKGLIYHDNVHDAGSDGETNRNWARNNSYAVGHNFGNGWTARVTPAQTFPYKIDSSTYADITSFCNAQGTTALANGQVPSDVCKTCLQAKGWYYDGFLLQRPIDGVSKQYPSIWYTGNYLNFFPPKFVAMRKILKDIVATQSKIRMALARFGGDGYKFLKEFNPTCAHPESSFDQNRGSYITLVNGVAFDGLAPLSRALFDVGRYYHSPGLSWFGSTWEKSNSGSGQDTWESSDNSNDYAICYSCQTSSVIVLTGATPQCGDGGGNVAATCTPAYGGTSLPPGGDGTSMADANAGRYAGDATTGILDVSTADCPSCAAFSGDNDYKNDLARVSWYLHNLDLRDNQEQTKDCKKNGGRQTLDVYTVGYGTSTQPDANAILAGAASAGGGLFVGAEDPSVLRSGLLSVLEEISGRSTSFSVATVSTLQTTSGHSVIVPRFDPEKSPFWKGHLYSYDLYSEFVNACDPTHPSAATSPPCCTPNGAGDLDCDGKCQSVFLQDKDGKFIQEGGDGFFYRNDPDTKAACAQAPACGTACGDVSSTPAQPWWDAATGLDATSWSARKVYTVVDTAEPYGRLDRTDGTLLLSTSDEVAGKIMPYLGVGGGQVCNRVADRIETAGDAVTATVVRTSALECTKTIIRWVLGADVFNAAGRKATDVKPWPPPCPDTTRPATVGIPPVLPNLPDQEQLPDRPYKLGDVFHSSPVAVDPPLPIDGILCPNGLHNQCLTALWNTPTEDANDAAYRAYSEATAYAHRRKIVLVGSNEGLLHAFNDGAWNANEDDPYTAGVDESHWPFFGYYDRGNSSSGIWAEELWAFLPPDLWPKLGLMLSGEHQLMVDGTAMVRDVWVDGSTNGLAGTSPADDVKQKQEFHTVAVVGERRGGTRYFALDITNATKLRGSGFTAPTFLWIYPQPSAAESLAFGESYDDFLPAPAPIGPVRIRADANSGGTHVKTKTMSLGGSDVPYHEEWIAFLSGGFDPNYLRGRGVHMVDVWSGREIWDFSYPWDSSLKDPNDPTSTMDSNDPRLALKYPVASAVGMVMWGPGSRRENGLGYANDGFFDTATFGDTGGQVWTLRFHVPGELGTADANGDQRVKNWYGARAFQMGWNGTSSSPSFGYQHPFFYITANTALPGSYIFRTYLGTGDRFNLLDTNGGICAPDNIRACLMRGCSVSLPATSNYLATPSLGRQKRTLSETGTGSTTYGSAAETAVTQVEGRARIEISGCPSPASSGDATSTTKDASFACTQDSAGRWGCSSTFTSNYGSQLSLSNSSNAPSVRNWYLSLRVFDDQGSRAPFATPDQAKAYDAARLWIRDTGGGTTVTQSGDIVLIDSALQNPTALATASSAGWAIYYNHGPSVVVDDVTYTVSKLDERTSSVSSLYGMLTWNTTQPSLSVSATTTSGSCFVSKCVAEDRRVAYHYAAHPLTGGSVLHDSSGNPIRAAVSNTLVPAQGDQPTVFVNQKGQVIVSQTVVNPEKGAGSMSSGGAMDSIMDLGWIEVSEATHACRHASSAPGAGVCR